MEAGNPTFRENGIVEKSVLDDREYQSITLANRMEVLLIHDKDTDKASAALDVGVGSLCDTDHAQGLAHFCEHMLFLGTEKYPDENSYNAFLSAHGGRSNAYTDQDHTNYYFDVNQEHLEGALDRFAQFFIAPLFTESATEREMNAVDSENAKNLQSDFWRTFQLYKSAARKEHPFNKFSTGNLQTLRDDPKEKGVDIRQELLQFHEKYYSSNLMKLVVLGRESLDELQQMVLKLFSAVQDKDVAPPEYPGRPYGDSELKKHFSVVPVRENRMIEVSFPLPPVREHFRAKPTRYLSHLLGHEGPGSILALLKKKGWANGLSAGNIRSLSDWAAFAVSIDATESGMGHMFEIVQIIFQYINMLRETGPQHWIFEETQTVAANNFRFQSKQQPINYCCNLASNMQLFPPDLTLAGPHLLMDYEPTLIQDILELFVPENMLLITVTRDFEGKTDLTEQWYQTPYSVADISPDLLASWASPGMDSELKLPDRNDFIATDFELKRLPDSPKIFPVLLRSTALSRVWYKQDNQFEKPKANVLLKISTPVAYESAEANVLTRLFVQLVKEDLNEIAYMADCAGLYYDTTAVREGFTIEVCGYNHKLQVLLEKILMKLMSFSPDDTALFERIKEKEEKHFKNQAFNQPYQHALLNTCLCLEEPRFGNAEKLAAIGPLTPEQLKDFTQRLFSRFNLEILVHGNYNAEEATSIADLIEQTMTPLRGSLAEGINLEARVVKTEATVSYVRKCNNPDPENSNSAIQIVYQVGPENLDQDAKLELLCHLLKEPAFNILRTQEQLGYLVFSGKIVLGEYIQGIRFIIQSDQKDAAYLDDRIEAFLTTYYETLKSMSAEEFQKNVQAVKEQILEKDKNLNEESLRYWKEILNGSYFFGRTEALASQVEGQTLEEIVQFFEDVLLASSQKRMKISAQMYGNLHKIEEKKDFSAAFEQDQGAVVILSPSAFKRSMPLYPLRPLADMSKL